MMNTMDLENKFEINSYKRLPLSIARGEGNYVFDEEGNRYLDLYGGHAVVGVGHCHPHLVAAIQDQAAQLIFYSNVVFNSIRGEAAKALADMMPEGLDSSFFVNSGAEANENAMKMARMIKGKPGILSFEGGFHGRTAAASAATGIKKVREAVSPILSHHYHVPFGDLDACDEILSKGQIAAVLLEPIQSMAGIVTAEELFFVGLRDLCSKHGVFLIFDEIQTGIGRTGDFCFAGRYGVLPDMVTLGKSIAGGLPMGAVVVGEAVSNCVSFGDLGTTFGGNPLVCRALIANLDIIEAENLLENVREVSQSLKSRLSELAMVKTVRGEGFLLGIEFSDRPASEVQKFLLDHKIITGLSGDPSVLRLLPALTLNHELDDFYLALSKLH